MNALPALVSPITFWELTVLIERGRIALDLDVLRWSRDLLAQEPVEIAPITPSIAIGAARLTGFHGDPADRLLYATAREMSVPLISKDGRIQRYARGHADVKVVW
jgi:PIN domain nuclease of toxin-antitoxin system